MKTQHYNTLLVTPNILLFTPKEGTDFRNYKMTSDGTIHINVLA